jgi:uncharacterized protein
VVGAGEGTAVELPPHRLWQPGRAKTVTFIVTQSCQLSCRYCYMVSKGTGRVMSFETARQTVDYLLAHRHLFGEPSVIWEFIGGEPFLEIELIDRIADYAKRQMYVLDHPWFESYRFNLTTNGLLYEDPRVQAFIRKNHRHLDIGVTLDGTRAKHDRQRVFPDGSGSYDRVIRCIPRWLEQFPLATTKVTLSHDDLPWLEDSVLHLFELGIRHINMNCVFEPVWEPGDDGVLEGQLRSLAEALVERQLYHRHSCSIFSRDIGKPLDPVEDNQNWCGAGVMLAVDHAGDFYPCTRYTEFCLTRRPARRVGNCRDGVSRNRLRPFLTLDRVSQSPPECIECEVASGCAWCQAANYDQADTATNFQRSVSLCHMHKARARANKYFWALVDAADGARTGEVKS